MQAQSVKTSRYYVDILVDDQLYAVTNSKAIANDTLHVYESLSLHDVPSQTRNVGVRMRRHDPLASVDNSNPHSNGQSKQLSKSAEAHKEDAVLGESVIALQELTTWRGTDQLIPLYNDTADEVGEISLDINHQQEVVMMENEYEKAIESFDKLAVPISLAISEQAQPPELPKVAERLLNIFLTCGNVQEWLVSLAEKEISAT